MAQNVLYSDITWARFETNNSNATWAFEAMCRRMFRAEFFNDSDDVFFASEPNYPGIEIPPVYDTKQGKTISFQAKYFSSAVSYQGVF